jgi:hypothetical protein
MTNPRSYLFVPADRPQRYAKALASGADVVIVDLEDAVAPADKDAARDALAQWISARDAAERIVVRINGVASPWFEAERASPALLRVAVSAGRAAATRVEGLALDQRIHRRSLRHRPSMRCSEQRSATQKTSCPRNTPKISTTRKIATAMKKSTLAMDLEPAATPLKPKKPAMSEMTKKMMAHLSMPASSA